LNRNLQSQLPCVLASRRPAGWPAITLNRLKDELHRLLAALDFPWDLNARQLVLLKPNLNHIPGQREWPGTTPLLLRALYEVIAGGTHARVAFLESPGIGRQAQDCYCLLRSLEPRLGHAEMIDPGSVPRCEMRSPLRGFSIRLPRVFLEAAVVVDIPRAKTHSLTGISVGIKNLFALLDEQTRRSNHTLTRVDAILADLVAIRPPEYTIVDCLAPIQGQGPLYGSAVPRGWILASTSVVSADTETAQVLGVDPETISHLSLARDGLARLGYPVKHSLQYLGDVGEPEVVLPAAALYNPFPQIAVIASPRCERGHLNAITHSLCRLEDEGWAPKEATVIVVGRTRQPTATNVRLICFGDQASKVSGRLSPTLIHGNPPDAFALYRALKDC
jgi:uncharacterized protein (DUF362 family)